MQNTNIICAILILIGLVGFYSQDLVNSKNKILRTPISKEISPGIANHLSSGSVYKNRFQEDQIRFSLFRSFDPPIWITLNLNTGKLFIDSFELEFMTGKNDIIKMEIEVDEVYIESLKNQISKIYLSSDIVETGIGPDGAIWRIELAWNGKYYASDRWSPDSGPEYKLGNQLLNRAARYISLDPIY